MQAKIMKARSLKPGFTVVELLVVIGILLILIALFTAGLKHVTMQAKQRDTKSMLATAVTMLENYKQATHFNRAYTTYKLGTGSYAPGALIYFTVDNTANIPAFATTPITDTRFWTQGQECAPGTEASNGGTAFPFSNITPDALLLKDPNPTHRPQSVPFPFLPQAVVNTEVIMEALLTVPGNQTILNNLPANKVVTDAVTGVPLLLDGFGNPILFVPGGGLANVWVDPGTYTGLGWPVITSVAIQKNGYDPTSTTGIVYSNQPFFVSAGPDGDISNDHGVPDVTKLTPPGPTFDMTDDNIYSFQN